MIAGRNPLQRNFLRGGGEPQKFPYLKSSCGHFESIESVKVREDSVKATVKGISSCSFLESVKLREGSVKATVKLKVLQELFLYFLRFPHRWHAAKQNPVVP